MKFEYWMVLEIIEADDYRDRCELMRAYEEYIEYEEYILASKVIK